MRPLFKLASGLWARLCMISLHEMTPGRDVDASPDGAHGDNSSQKDSEFLLWGSTPWDMPHMPGKDHSPTKSFRRP